MVSRGSHVIGQLQVHVSFKKWPNVGRQGLYACPAWIYQPVCLSILFLFTHEPALNRYRAPQHLRHYVQVPRTHTDQQIPLTSTGKHSTNISDLTRRVTPSLSS